MTAVAHAWPTLQEELNSKTFATLEWLISSVDKGRLTEQQFSTGVDTLFMAVSGLVDESFIGVITEAQSQCNSGKYVVKRHFHAPAGDEVRSFSWSPGESNVTVVKRICGVAVSGFAKECDDAKAAVVFMRSAADLLAGKGWFEL